MVSIFSKKEDKKEVKDSAVDSTVKTEDSKVSAKAKTSQASNDLSWVIISPRITEKAAFLTGFRGYTFNIDPRANKIEVKKAIKQIYGVDVVKVTTSTQSPRKTIKRGRKVHKTGSKKAVVFLKEGDKIEFV